MAQLEGGFFTRQDAKLLGFVLAMTVGILVIGAVFRPHEMLRVWIDRAFSAALGAITLFYFGPKRGEAQAGDTGRAAHQHVARDEKRRGKTMSDVKRTKTEKLLKQLAMHLGYGHGDSISDSGTEEFALKMLDACKQAKREMTKGQRVGLATDAIAVISGYFEDCGRESDPE